LYQRVIPSSLASSTISNHATVISSIIGGAGNSYYDGLGIANACRFFSSSFADLFADNITVLKNANVTIQNHSYGTIIQPFYGAEAVSYDAQSWSDNILHVFSAGNQGTITSSEGRYAGIPGYANLTGNFKSAKNVVTVGAIDNKGNLVAESSAGPLYDGRLAPQLIALGPNGTSDAAAMVTGTSAVLQQVYADSNQGSIPSSALIRSAMYTTADDIHKNGIDHKTGFGLLNSYNAVRLIQQKKYFTATIAPGDHWSEDLQISANISQLKITLCWNDLPAAINNLSALINDLDLELLDLGTGRTYQPWVLSSFPSLDSLERFPVRGRDSLNTAEQISIEMPGAGSYRINVYSRSGNTAIPFAVTWLAETQQSFRFTSPQQAADINPENNPSLSIRWSASKTEYHQTGDLFVSYNKGVSFTSIASGLSLSSGIFNWNLPDTSSTARFMMRTSFGEFSSPDVVIAKLIRPRPDFVCEDSFRLSWTNHVYAQSYTIYSLTDSSHMKPVINTRDTFVVFNRKMYPF
ncbi:MAG: S8 family serine peptidase, partial [Chitinophagaceae bacterium]|nr:S8 family serine peptidase [Chitinophagaceae bacterium]